MANPFPGVNPFIEASGRWTGFHNLLIAHCSELLNETLPPNYAAFVEERLELVESPDEPSRIGRPDLSIVEASEATSGLASRSGLTADLQPAMLTLPELEEVPEAYIDIRSLPDRQLITSIEILSPSNKATSGRTEYWAKRAAMLRQGIHLVEIDLLLGGRRLEAVEPLPPGDFYAFISRSNYRPRCDVYGWSIRRQIPNLPIPLKPPDADVILDLSGAFAATFNRNRYDRTLRYDLSLPVELGESDQAWLVEQLASIH